MTQVIQDKTFIFTDSGGFEIFVRRWAHHEILNEANRDEVHRDLLAWFDARV
jgi:hypothetical protein